MKEALIPFSSLMEQLRYGSHMVPSSASPTGSTHTNTHTQENTQIRINIYKPSVSGGKIVA